MNEQAAAWLTAVEGLPAVHARLARVVILNHDAIDVIRQQDSVGTLLLPRPALRPRDLDVTRGVPAARDDDRRPPPSHGSGETGQGESAALGLSERIYDTELAGWERNDFPQANHAASGKEKRQMVECVWCNFRPG